MKIENFALDLNSKASKSSKTVVKTFVSELESENSKRVEELKSAQESVEFFRQFAFKMIQEFILRLQSRSCQPPEFNFDEFEQKSFTTQEVRVEKEYMESQSLEVGMCGIVETATGSIELDLNFCMSHSFVQKHQILKTQFYDPLVISFDGELPQLDDKCFSFDIDCDGDSEQLSLLKGSNGFLALDKNSNGAIDDGSELFGTQNGDGFADLRRYDVDKNGWIDECDPIMDGLRIWIKNGDENSLLALGEVGIGALYLGETRGSFELKSEAEETLGKICSSGLYLNEDGTSGLLSQIDFARRNQHAKETSGILGDLLRMA
jgi:hypothetical protein